MDFLGIAFCQPPTQLECITPRTMVSNRPPILVLLLHGETWLRDSCHRSYYVHAHWLIYLAVSRNQEPSLTAQGWEGSLQTIQNELRIQFHTEMPRSYLAHGKIQNMVLRMVQGSMLVSSGVVLIGSSTDRVRPLSITSSSSFIA